MELIREKFERVRTFFQPKGITKRWVLNTLCAIVAVIVLVVSIAIKIWMSSFNKKAGEMIS